jgi:hypothetical protein
VSGIQNDMYGATDAVREKVSSKWREKESREGAMRAPCLQVEGITISAQTVSFLLLSLIA